MSSGSSGRAGALAELAQRLRLYKPHSSSEASDDFNSTKASVIHDSTDESAPKGTRAAVLICLFEGEKGDLRVILTKRSSNLSSHSGEVSLPGGKWEAGDESDADTALREAKEEIGLDPSVVEVVATLEPFFAKHLFRVVPVIGILWDKNDFNPVPNAGEVESVFDAPLEMFLKNENRREMKNEWNGYEHLLHFFDYKAKNETYVIWAFTAAILIQVASVVYQRPPAFEECRPIFWTRSRL